jgi:hypothetical protein
MTMLPDSRGTRRKISLWYGEPNAIGYAKYYSRSHDAVIRVYDEAGQRDRSARARGRVPRAMSILISRQSRT